MVVPVLVTRALPHSLRGELAGPDRQVVGPVVDEGRVLAASA
jgi:hypothetical protein